MQFDSLVGFVIPSKQSTLEQPDFVKFLDTVFAV